MPIEESEAPVVPGPEPRRMADDEHKDLLLAIFEQAMEDLLSGNPKKQKLEQAWFESNERGGEDQITFIHICDVMNWEPSWIRKLIAKKVAANV